MVESRNELLRKQAEKQDRMVDLLQHCSKISNGLDKLASNSGDRAIWELVQNAKDLSEECHICMTLSKDSFVFAHKGTPFNYETLTSLIKQVSSSEKQFRKKNDDGQPKVGQYGTGFLTTHAFSRKIELKGSMEASLEEEPPCYVRLEDTEGHGFIIDREFTDIKEFVEKMNDQIEAAQELLYKTVYTKPSEWTQLHYMLNDAALKKATVALEQAKRLMPFVIAFNDKIKDVRIVSKLDEDSFDITYQRESESQERIANYLVNHVRVGITGQKSRDVYCLCSDDMEQQIVIPPTVFPEPEKTPSLFLYYPLLGTETFGTNFIFHSCNFTAKEERDGIILPSNNENTKEKFEKNVRILNGMVGMLLDFLKNANDERFSLCNNTDLARVYFTCVGNDAPEQDEFFTELKQRFVSCMETLPLLSTGTEKVCVESGKVKVFHPSLYETLKDEQLEQNLDVLKKYASLAHAIPDVKPLEWSQIVTEWDAEKDDYFITYQSICSHIKDKGDKLIEFLRLMQAAGQGDLMATNCVIPNRKGVLCTGASLQKAPTVTAQLYEISEPLLGEKADKLVDPYFSEFIEREEYTRKNLREDMTTWLTEKKKEYLENGNEFPEDLIQALIRFCSHYPSAGLNAFRNNMMPLIGKLYGYEQAECVLPSMEEKETDLYETPYGFLVECALLTISHKDKEWVEGNGDMLFSMMSHYLKKTEERWTEKLKKYAVIPNQKRELCLLEKLKKREAVMDEPLRKIYEDVFHRDPREEWIDERYESFCNIPVQTAKALAGEIQTELESRDYKDDAVLDIIALLEDHHWPQGLFEGINGQKEKLRYNFTTPIQRAHINKLIKAKNDKLLESFAEIVNKSNPELVVELTQKAILDAERQEYIKKLGNYVEQYLLVYLEGQLKEYGISVRDEQCGQDYVLYKDGYKDYLVEVKSRWSVDKSVELSKLQFATAVANAERFALVMANMEDFPRERVDRDDPLTGVELVNRIKVLDNIGDYHELFTRVEAAFKGGEDDIKADGTYSIRVPQAVFTGRNLNLIEFVEIIKNKFVGGEVNKYGHLCSDRV